MSDDRHDMQDTNDTHDTSTLTVNKGYFPEGYFYESGYDPEDNDGQRSPESYGWIVGGPGDITFRVETETEAKLWADRLNIAWRSGRRDAVDMFDQVTEYFKADDLKEWMAQRRAEYLAGVAGADS